MRSVRAPSSFPLLSATFVSCYRDFDRYYKQWQRENPQTEPSYLMFGTSGAGKSTLMGRLLSGEEPEAFVTHLKADSAAGFTMIGDVKVGHTPLKSTTLIPRGYSVSGMSIFDMPGFQDFDDDRRIIISILHKCLLTRLRAVKFVVVLGIEALNSKVPVRGLLDYCEAFEQLFGDKFSSYMEHVYFVLTKNDQVGMKAQDVKLALFEIMMGAGSLGRASVNMFITRLTQHHVIIDYSKYSADETREQIVDMLRRGQLANSEGLVADTLNINTLEAQENELTKKCDEELNRLTQAVEKRDVDFRADRDRAMVDLAGLRKAADGHIGAHIRIIEEASAAYAELASVESALAAYSSKREKIHSEVVRHTTQQKFCEEQLSYLKDSVAGFENVNFRCDVAKVPSGLLNNRYAVNITLALNHHMNGGRYVILVTRFEDDDRTLRSHIASVERWPVGTQPLIPKHMGTIENFSNDIVLFHSQKAINKAPNDIKIINDNKFVTIDAKQDKPFKVFVYYSMPFSETTAYEGLKEQFDSKLTESAKSAQEATKQAKELDDANVTNITRKANLLQIHKMSVTKIRDSADVLSNQLNGIAATGKAKHDALGGFQLAADPESYPTLLSVDSINEIYNANRLRTDLVARTAALRARLDNLRSGISAARSTLDKEAAAAIGALTASIHQKPVIPEGLQLPHHN